MMRSYVMKKLIRGILNFREVKRDSVAETFHALALGQKPDALLIACSDSRVAVNIFASDDPGDLFVVRNVGNLVPPHDDPGNAGTAAAVDFAVALPTVVLDRVALWASMVLPMPVRELRLVWKAEIAEPSFDSAVEVALAALV